MKTTAFCAISMALFMAGAHARPDLAVIEDGKVAAVRSYGIRNAKGDPLPPETVVYGASLTKTVFAYAGKS